MSNYAENIFVAYVCCGVKAGYVSSLLLSERTRVFLLFSFFFCFYCNFFFVFFFILVYVKDILDSVS